VPDVGSTDEQNGRAEKGRRGWLKSSRTPCFLMTNGWTGSAGCA
jgi:hypothetical protein